MKLTTSILGALCGALLLAVTVPLRASGAEDTTPTMVPVAENNIEDNSAPENSQEENQEGVTGLKGSPMAGGYRLIWEDNFTGDTLNRNLWNIEVNGDGGGNNEWQYYTAEPRNVAVRDGHLVITARKENYHNKQYTSGRINTSGRFSFRYGKIEFRAKLARGRGIWPAFWLLPQDNIYGNWPLSGEIDVMELFGQDNLCNVVHGSLNYGDPWPHNRWTNAAYTLPGGRGFADDFHVFSVEWEPNVIRWYVDGAHYSTKTPTDLGQCRSGPCPWRMDQRFFVIINLAVGGNPVPSPDGSTSFPQEMLVDYVKVYQRQ